MFKCFYFELMLFNLAVTCYSICPYKFAVLKGGKQRMRRRVEVELRRRESFTKTPWTS